MSQILIFSLLVVFYLFFVSLALFPFFLLTRKFVEMTQKLRVLLPFLSKKNQIGFHLTSILSVFLTLLLCIPLFVDPVVLWSYMFKNIENGSKLSFTTATQTNMLMVCYIEITLDYNESLVLLSIPFKKTNWN